MGYAAAWFEEVYLSCVRMPHLHIGTDLGMEGSAVTCHACITCLYIWGWWLDREKELYQRNEPRFIFRGDHIHCPHLQHIFEFSQQKIKKKNLSYISRKFVVNFK